MSIVVVDNASSGNDVQLLDSLFGDNITIIKNKKNEGFAAGNNTGMTHAITRIQPDYVWLLNNDAYVDATSPFAQIDFFKKFPGISIVGSKILYPDKETIYCLGGGKLNVWTGIDRLYGAKMRKQKKIDVHPLSYISGCSLFMNKDALSVLKGFDNDYFLYNEDVDLCHRALHAGLQLSYCQESIVYHKSSQSTSESPDTYTYYFLRNKLIFLHKNCRWWHYPTYITFFVLYYCAGFFLKNTIRRRKLPLKVILRAMTDFLKRRWSYQAI